MDTERKIYIAPFSISTCPIQVNTKKNQPVSIVEVTYTKPESNSDDDYDEQIPEDYSEPGSESDTTLSEEEESKNEEEEDM